MFCFVLLCLFVCFRYLNIDKHFSIIYLYIITSFNIYRSSSFRICNVSVLNCLSHQIDTWQTRMRVLFCFVVVFFSGTRSNFSQILLVSFHLLLFIFIFIFLLIYILFYSCSIRNFLVLATTFQYLSTTIFIFIPFFWVPFHLTLIHCLIFFFLVFFFLSFFLFSFLFIFVLNSSFFLCLFFIVFTNFLWPLFSLFFQRQRKSP